MQTPKKWIFYILIALTSFSVSFLTCEFTFGKTKANTTEITENTKDADTYTVKEYGGKIAVFLNNDNIPVYILGSPFIRDLPQYDRELLESGITVKSKQELVKLLEDYDG